MSIVVPAVLPSSKKELDDALALLARIPSIDRVQIDAVDGRLASPASWPYTNIPEFRRLIKSGWQLPNLSKWVYEIDLMSEDAEIAAGLWLAAGASRLTFHAKNVHNLPYLLAGVRRRYGDGLASPLLAIGLALNVAADPALVEPYVGEIEYVQFMGIARIGVQGQPFDPRVVERVRTFHARHPEVPLQVDGGVDVHTARSLLTAGASRLIVGHAILRAKDPRAAVAAIEALEPSYGV